MDYYQHDGATTFRFQIAGELAGPGVTELEHAWLTASSIMNGKQLVLDLSKLTGADSRGVQLLRKMLAAGARLVATQPPASPETLESLGAPVDYTTPRRTPRNLWSRVTRIFTRG